MHDKRKILNAIATLAKELGRTPSLVVFVARSGISRRSVQCFFPKWNDAVRASRLLPYTQNVKVEDRALLKDWGNAVRRNRGVPSHRAYMRDGKYDASTLYRRFGSWKTLAEAFRNFAKDNREWKDVLALLPAQAPKKESGPSQEDAGSPILPAQAPHAPLQPQLHLHLKDRPTYGHPTSLRWLRYEPVNEQGVVLLFGMLAPQLGYLIEKVQTDFPDCEAMRQVSPERWQRVLIEFEFESRNFRDHGHAATGCDVIVCWRHNWEECPECIEVVELSRVLKTLPA